MSEWVRQRFRETLASATVAINERRGELLARGVDVFNLGLGQSPFPVPEPVVEALRRHAAEKDYLPVAGLPALREAVAAHHATVDGIQATASQVLVGPGSKELLFLLQLVLEGEVLIPTPCWVTYPPHSRMAQRRVRLLHTSFENGWRLGPDLLAAACQRLEGRGRGTLLVLNSPNNPTGLCYDPSELSALAEVARRHQLLVFSDEIYGRLHHGGEHVSFARFYPEGTIVGSGLSKWCGAGGWRLGTFLLPAAQTRLQAALVAAASESFTSVSAPVQYAAVEAFAGGGAIESYLFHARRILRTLGHRLFGTLGSAGARVHEPQGAFYLFPDFGAFRPALASRGVEDAPELAERLLGEAHVALLPGAPFGRKPRELTLRLAYVDFDGGAAIDGSRRIGPDRELGDGFVERYCPRPLEAVQRLCDWVRSAPPSADEA